MDEAFNRLASVELFWQVSLWAIQHVRVKLTEPSRVDLQYKYTTWRKINVDLAQFLSFDRSYILEAHAERIGAPNQRCNLSEYSIDNIYQLKLDF